MAYSVLILRNSRCVTLSFILIFLLGMSFLEHLNNTTAAIDKAIHTLIRFSSKAFDDKVYNIIIIIMTG